MSTHSVSSFVFSFIFFVLQFLSYGMVDIPNKNFQDKTDFIHACSLAHAQNQLKGNLSEMNFQGNDPNAGNPDPNLLIIAYVPDEIIIKFNEQAAVQVESRLRKGGKIQDAGLSEGLKRLYKKHQIDRPEPLFRNFRETLEKHDALKNKDLKTLNKKESHLFARHKRAPKDVSIPALDRIYKIKVKPTKGRSLQEIADELERCPDVEYAELNYCVSAFSLPPNDPLFTKQWALHNTGQEYPPMGYGDPDCDIDALEAWQATAGSSNIIVAVIDTGVDYTHRDLTENMWINPGEIADDEIDNDNNGYVDDLYGYDFCTDAQSRDSDPLDDNGHGTHCAGIIGAEGDSENDIAGVNWTSRIMAVKFLSSSGTGETDDAAEAIYYAVNNGADVLSNSWGGGPYSQVLQDAIDYAFSRGVIFVAAAGNNYPWLDRTTPQYPANMNHVIAVAATDSTDQLADFSYYGDWIDIAAPGVDILSLRASGTSMGTPYDGYTTTASGTSMACPHVAGACALILSNPSITDTNDIPDLILFTGDRIADGICSSDMRLNADHAVKASYGQGFVSFNHSAYTFSDLIQIHLTDKDLDGQTDPNVILTSSSGDMETVVLTPTGVSWIFTDSLYTGSGSAVQEDGTLQISHGDTILVTYSDAKGYDGNPCTATASAEADCEGPVVSAVDIDAPGAIAVITFTTDEPATAVIRCSTFCGDPNGIEAGSEELTTSHTIRLGGYQPQTDYYLEIEVEDSLGNVTLDDNEGSCYGFTSSTPMGTVSVPSQDCLTIQAGIDRAWDGETVVVADGIYTGEGNYNLNYYGKSITVSSQNGPEACIINCQGRGRAFVFINGEDPNSAVDGFTITHGYPTINYNPSDPRDAYAGGAIYSLASRPTITNCRFVANSADLWGGAVFSWGTGIQITNSVFQDNKAGTMGGAIYCAENLVLENCLINNNRLLDKVAGYGAGLCCFGNTLISQCEITGNYFTMSEYRDLYFGYSTGILHEWGSIEIQSCMISDNGKPRTCYFEGSTIVMNNCVISQNTGTGVLLYSDNNAAFVNCTVADNQGTGIYCIASNTVTLNNCIIWDNVNASNKGNNIYLSTLQDYPNFMTISYTDVISTYPSVYVQPGGSQITWGLGHIGTDPLFSMDGDYHLTVNSPCLDSGTNAPAGGLPGEDIEGTSRPLDGDGNSSVIADMGAYEFVDNTPTIALSGVAFDFSSPEGNGTYEDQYLLIANSGEGSLAWQISETCPWLSISPVEGIAAGEPNTVIFSIDSEGLAGGDYSCEVTICSASAANSPRTIHVNLYVRQTFQIPDDFLLIQGAVNIAKEGDILLLDDGVYTGYGNRDIEFFGENLTIRSKNGPDACILDCMGTNHDPHRAFNFYASYRDSRTVLEGITMTGGYISSGILDIFPPFDGGALFLEDSSPTLRNCVLKSNRSYYYGGAIALYYNEATEGYLDKTFDVSNCIIRDNQCGIEGGGLWTALATNIDNTIFENNTCMSLGGAFISYHYTTVRNSMFYGNVSYGNGGAVCAPYSLQDFYNCTFADNYAGNYGGGIFVDCRWEPNDFTELENNILWGNDAAYGPQIALYSTCEFSPPQVAISYCDISGGQNAIYQCTGSVLTWGDGNIDEDPEFEDPQNDDYHLSYESPCMNAGDPNWIPDPNRSDIDGESRILFDVIDMGADEFSGFANGIYNVNQRIWYTTIQGAINAASSGDKIVLCPGTYSGSGNRDLNPAGKNLILTSMDPFNSDIVDSTILDCGGSVSDKHRAFTFVNGEGPSTLVSGLTIINGHAPNVTFDGYDYQMGGAIYCEGSSPVISYCVLTDNEADMNDAGLGGAVSCYESDVQILNCMITENKANCGGGIFAENGTPQIRNCVIQANNSYYASGIYLYGNADAAFVNCTIVENITSKNYAGGMGICDSDPLITNCIIWGNDAYDYDQIQNAGGNPVISFSDIQDCFIGGVWDSQLGTNGGGNIDQDPEFLTDGYHLDEESPCIDDGTNSAVEAGDVDIDGEDRILDGDGDETEIVDIGADEYNPD